MRLFNLQNSIVLVFGFAFALCSEVAEPDCCQQAGLNLSNDSLIFAQ